MLDTNADSPEPSPKPPGRARPYVGIHFECCRVYARVYRQPGQSEYVGRCPKCLARVRLRVGRDGVSTRFFRAT